LFSVALEHPGRRNRGGGAADDPMLNELGWRRRNAMAFEIIGRGNDNSRDCRDELGCRGRIHQATEVNSDVDSFPDEILPPVLEKKLDMEVRVARRERGPTGDHSANAEARRHAHPQQATNFAALANALFSLIERGEDRLHPCEKRGARLGGHNGARGSRKQPGAEVALEIGDDARGLGLRRPHSRAAAEKLPSLATRV
jgi:hypothetical protein